MQAKVVDQINEIIISKFKIMIIINIAIMIMAVILIPFAARLNPQREYTRTIRITFSILGLVFSIFSLVGLCLYLYRTIQEQKREAGIESTRAATAY